MPGCHKRANCDLTGKYVALISDGYGVSVWDFKTWNLPSLQSSQILSASSVCGNLFTPQITNIGNLNTSATTEIKYEMVNNFHCGTYPNNDYVSLTQILNEAITVKEIQFITNNVSLPPVKVEVYNGNW